MPTAVPVLHLITGLRIGGAERALQRLVERLDRRRFDPSVACLGYPDGPVARALAERRVPVHHLGVDRCAGPPRRSTPRWWTATRRSASARATGPSG